MDFRQFRVYVDEVKEGKGFDKDEASLGEEGKYEVHGVEQGVGAR